MEYISTNCSLEKIKSRYKSWWKQENTDRPLFYMHVHENGGIDESRYFKNPEERWLNIGKILDYEEKKMSESIFPAETYPAVTASLGPGSLATFLGSEPGFTMETVWYSPCFQDISEADITFNKDSGWWQWTCDFTRTAVERSDGKYLVEIPDLIENFDILASLLGTENLLYGTFDCPQEIHRLQNKLLPAWFEAFNHLYALVRDEEGGMSWGGFGVWAPGRFAKIQCDISLMLSAGMFGEFVLPYLKEQCDGLDYSLYHLDGPEALKHLDHILTIEALGAIQWQPGAGAPDAIDPCWYDVQRKILNAGKSIVVFIKPYVPDLVNRLEAFVREVGKKGVLIVIEQYMTDARTAHEIVDRSYNW